MQERSDPTNHVLTTARVEVLGATVLGAVLCGLALVATGCGKQEPAQAPPPASPPPVAPAQPAAPAPAAVTGHPNLPGFVRPTAPVATVNGKPIAAERFNREFDRLVGSGVRIPADRIKHIARNILGRLIEDELRTQAIIRERIELTDAEFDDAWQEHMNRYKDADGQIDKAQLKSNLARNRIDIDELKQRIRRERLSRKLVEKIGKLDVSADETRRFYDSNASAWIEKESRDVRPILIEVKADAPKTAWGQAQTKAADAYSELHSGGDFETIAKRFGDVPRAPIHLTRSSAEQELVRPAFELKVGEVAKPIRTRWGFFVIRLIAKNDERTRTYPEVKGEIEKRIRERKLYLEGQRVLREMRGKGDIVEKLPF